MTAKKACGHENPEVPGMRCERSPCVEYHRNGNTIWLQDAQPMPSKKTDPIRVVGIVRRTKDKARRERNG